MRNSTVTRVRFVGKRKVELVDDTLPDKLEAGNVLVRVETCGICGSDLLLYTGRWKQQGTTPGHEFAGIVTETGPGVTSAASGDRVTAAPMLACGACSRCREGTPALCSQNQFLTVQRDGAMATHVILPEYTLHRIPENLPSNEAVLIEPLSVAVHCFRRLGNVKGIDVGIVGAGTLGLMCVYAAKEMGAAHVVCVAKHPFQAKLAESLGADKVIEGTSVPNNLSGSQDVAVDCVGGRGEAFRQVMKLVRREGSIIAVGGYHGLAGVDMEIIVRNEITVIGSFCYSERDGRHDMDVAADMAAACREKLQSLITHTFPLREVEKALETALDKEKNRSVKVVLTG